ncbi:MAG TPA: hypothetical protein VJ978_02525 [Nitriliruptoraceae bacterium]|nr:hypothetical protein [Nitriliruptoraceae bacterium]
MFEPDLQRHPTQTVMQTIGMLQVDQQHRDPTHHAITVGHQTSQFTQLTRHPITSIGIRRRRVRRRRVKPVDRGGNGVCVHETNVRDMCDIRSVSMQICEY